MLFFLIGILFTSSNIDIDLLYRLCSIYNTCHIVQNGKFHINLSTTVSICYGKCKFVPILITQNE